MRRINFPDNNIKNFNANEGQIRRADSVGMTGISSLGRIFSRFETNRFSSGFDIDFDSLRQDLQAPKSLAEDHIFAFKAKLNSSEVWIDSRRIDRGFSAGLIDLVKGVVYKDGDHWFHDTNKLDCETKEELENYIANVVKVVPFLSNKDISDMDSLGEVVISGQSVAKRSGENEWVLTKTGRSLSGNAERVLHHQDMAVVLPSSSNDIDMYHGLTQSSGTYEHNGWKTLPSSKQGEGCYATLSKREAICVYANPKSMEVGSKKYSNPDIPELQVARDYGFLLSVKPHAEAHIFQADLAESTSFKDCSNMPSPYLIEKLVDSYKTDNNAYHMDLAGKRAIMSIINSTNTFDIYMALNVLQDEVQRHVERDLTSQVSILRDSFSSMGYDSVLIKEPSKEVLELKSILVSELKKPLSDTTCSLEDNGVNPVGVLKSINDYFSAVEKNLPPKLEGGHFISFDSSMYPSVSKVTSLPVHTAVLTGEFPDPRTGYSDTFYDLKNDNLDRFSDFSIKMEVIARRSEHKGVDIPLVSEPSTKLKM